MAVWFRHYRARLWHRVMQTRVESEAYCGYQASEQTATFTTDKRIAVPVCKRCNAYRRNRSVK